MDRNEQYLSDVGKQDSSVHEVVLDRVSESSFQDWYDERRTAENVLEGQAYFNSPAPTKDPERHSPSQLRQCRRKISYRRNNAPKEGEQPTGIFFVGNTVEEELVVPFLQSVTPDGAYVANSVWVDSEFNVDGTSLRIRGSTDPAITTADGDPIFVTEVKTTSSIEYLDAPRAHHRAQLQAYLFCLDQEYDRDVTVGVIVYISRDTLDLRAFPVSFDPDYWWDTVVPWMAELTEYEQAGELPPDDPETDWECEYCDFRNRCGKADTPFNDVGYDGLLPLFSDYDRQNLEEYLEAHEDRGARLTPTLAHEYPTLAREYGVYRWSCTACEADYEWDEVDWDGDVEAPPFCPACIDRNDMVVLSGPEPGEQLTR